MTRTLSLTLTNALSCEQFPPFVKVVGANNIARCEGILAVLEENDYTNRT